MPREWQETATPWALDKQTIGLVVAALHEVQEGRRILDRSFFWLGSRFERNPRETLLEPSFNLEGLGGQLLESCFEALLIVLGEFRGGRFDDFLAFRHIDPDPSRCLGVRNQEQMVEATL